MMCTQMTFAMTSRRRVVGQKGWSGLDWGPPGGRETNTNALHAAVADGRASVWLGRFGRWAKLF